MMVEMTGMPEARFLVRPYHPADRQAMRSIYGDDEFARPRLLRRYPRMREYFADEASSYYIGYEPESIFVAEAKQKTG